EPLARFGGRGGRNPSRPLSEVKNLRPWRRRETEIPPRRPFPKALLRFIMWGFSPAFESTFREANGSVSSVSNRPRPPMLQKLQRYRLTFGPTHIERLDRLSKHLGGKVELYAKREDCNSGLAFGGNKLRKLEYIIPDAIASNADTLVSIGGVQSNHTRMVAAVAAKIGMKCRLVQESWVPHEEAG